jgi:hypothetical protein
MSEEIKVGDEVRIKDSVTSPIYGWGNRNIKGEEGVVTSLWPGSDKYASLSITYPSWFTWNGLITEVELSNAENYEDEEI